MAWAHAKKLLADDGIGLTVLDELNIGLKFVTVIDVGKMARTVGGAVALGLRQ